MNNKKLNNFDLAIKEFRKVVNKSKFDEIAFNIAAEEFKYATLNLIDSLNKNEKDAFCKILNKININIYNKI